MAVNKQNLGNATARILNVEGLESKVATTAECTLTSDTLTSPEFPRDSDTFDVEIHGYMEMDSTGTSSVVVRLLDEDDTIVYSRSIASNTWGSGDYVRFSCRILGHGGRCSASVQSTVYDGTTTDDQFVAFSTYTFAPGTGDGSLRVQMTCANMDDPTAELFCSIK